MYTSNVYLITGSHNAIDDVNTMVDVGRDPAIIPLIQSASTGVGKKRIAQVILTHSHYDHVSLLPEIQELFNPVTFAYSPYLSYNYQLLKDGDMVRLGDRMFEVIHTPGHSKDSVCLYCAEEEILFVGDTPVISVTGQGNYEPDYIAALEKISQRSISTIYLGHGAPITLDCNRQISESLQRMKKHMRKTQQTDLGACA